MDETDVSRAIAAATSIAEGLNLTIDDARVLQNSNKLSLRLSPCEIFARVAHVGREVAELEIEIAQQLAVTQSPVAALDPRVEPLPYERDGFVVTLWTYYEPMPDHHVSPLRYASALAHLHAGMRELDVITSHFTARVQEAQDLVESPELTPALATEDRTLLAETLTRLRQATGNRPTDEQLLHGEPHPGNLVNTSGGLRFVDLETCCRGPVEFDLAHVPTAVSDQYPNVDHDLLHDCRELVLAMVAAWRWDRTDRLPNGRQAGRDLLTALRAGPPWPALGIATPD